MSMIYRWKPRVSIGVKAQLAGEALEELRVRHEGRLTPRMVVTAARAKRSPLHPAFEWDDGAAASSYREDQARYMLRSITVVIKTKEKPDADQRVVRAFVNVTQDEESAYVSIACAMGDKNLRKQVLARALKELEVFRERYRDYAELAEVFAAIDKLER